MEATAALENLWLYLQSLPTSNKKWLAEKLIDDLKVKEDTEYITKEELLTMIDAGLKDVKTGKGKPARKLLEELRDGL